MDRRNIEIVATGLRMHHGMPLACDVTLVSPLRADGTPRPRAAERDGVAIADIEDAKHKTYPELARPSSGCKFLVLACEVGGRWSNTSCQFVRDLATEKSMSAPPRLRRAAALAWENRWWSMLSVAVHDNLAATLVDDAPHLLHAWEGRDPPLGELLHGEAPTESRLPLR